MFDELENSPGLISTVELAMDLHLLDEEGDLWRRSEPDWTSNRSATSTYTYQLKLEARATKPCLPEFYQHSDLSFCICQPCLLLLFFLKMLLMSSCVLLTFAVF